MGPSKDKAIPNMSQPRRFINGKMRSMTEKRIQARSTSHSFRHACHQIQLSLAQRSRDHVPWTSIPTFQAIAAMRKKNDSSGSEQSVNRDEKKYIAGAVRKEEPRRSSIGKSSLVQRARAFDPKFNGNFDERRFKTYNGQTPRSASWTHPSTSEEKEPAYLFVSPTLTDRRRKSMEEHILFNMKNEENLLMPRQSPQQISYGICWGDCRGIRMKRIF